MNKIIVDYFRSRHRQSGPKVSKCNANERVGYVRLQNMKFVLNFDHAKLVMDFYKNVLVLYCNCFDAAAITYYCCCFFSKCSKRAVKNVNDIKTYATMRQFVFLE